MSFPEKLLERKQKKQLFSSLKLSDTYSGKTKFNYFLLDIFAELN